MIKWNIIFCLGQFDFKELIMNTVNNCVLRCSKVSFLDNGNETFTLTGVDLENYDNYMLVIKNGSVQNLTDSLNVNRNPDDIGDKRWYFDGFDETDEEREIFGFYFFMANLGGDGRPYFAYYIIKDGEILGDSCKEINNVEVGSMIDRRFERESQNQAMPSYLTLTGNNIMESKTNFRFIKENLSIIQK
jgi:hypothetical protein